MADVSRPKKPAPKPAAADSAGQRLVIPKRTVITPIIDDDAEAVATPEPSEHAAAPKPYGKDVQPQMTAEKAPEAKPEAEPTAHPDEPTPPAPEPKPEPTPPTPPAPEPDKPEPAADDPDDAHPESADDDANSKTPPQVRKALEEAHRDQELQKIIEGREYFVPINAVARKRSVKVSLALVALELALGVLLLNLMLDAGIIELLDKIPHTNFFHIH